MNSLKRDILEPYSRSINEVLSTSTSVSLDVGTLDIYKYLDMIGLIQNAHVGLRYFSPIFYFIHTAPVWECKYTVPYTP